MTMDIDTLRTFLAITETGSFTGAGSRVGRTQSAISQQIRKLEDRLGVSLLVRGGQGTSLTAAGTRLVPLAREVIDAHDRALAAFGGEGRGGRVALGVPELYGERLVPLILPEFREKYPDVEVTIEQNETAGLLQSLNSGRLDMTLFTDAEGAVGVGPALYRNEVVWACAKDLELEKLRPLPVVVWREGSHHRRVMLGGLDRAGLPYRIALSTQSVSGIMSAVSAGIGLGMILRLNLSKDMREVPASVGLPKPTPPVLYLAEHESTVRNPAAIAMARHVRETVPNLKMTQN
ncbi:MAG: LysR family transcriptional regulator [Boseongicola sp.]|nr:MAG: LysR family transcriptional regulator [Boseongicola sp.]